MKTYTFKKTDKGYIGKAFEMAIKDSLNRKNAEKVSSQGMADFRYHNKNYDTKQNGSCIKYANSKTYVKGSNRVIYSTHIDYTIEAETDTEISLSVNLADTNMFVLDKKEFVSFLLENGYAKHNTARGEINIQTCYNYKKNAYHGRLGRKIEDWCYENEIDDDIIGDILDNLEG